MAKCLTLNTHSWMEVNALKKLVDLAEHIMAEKYEIICLQEINQLIDSEVANELFNYQQVPGTPSIHKDNFALILVNYLRKHGHDYYWSWTYNHIGYGIYHEGVAILSKEPMEVSDVLISKADDERDFHTRRALVARTQLLGREVTVLSLHMSWYGKGFEDEWARLESHLLEFVDGPLMLMGDFNNPTDLEGYQMIEKSPLNLQDSHKVADFVFGDHSMMKDIDGWEGNQHTYKVDHIFTSRDFEISSSEITFEGGYAPVVSDHFGLEITIK
ncbi:endonuclease/exonuclease/phosphatase family protein [Streptococcus hongkongensis]|nr:exodeoxyribonuclease III [Streptococcus uberis]